MPEPIPCPRGCGRKIETVFSFEPFLTPLGETKYRTVTSVSQDALRVHLRDHHTRRKGQRA